MNRLGSKIIPQKVKNYGKHLPTALAANIRYRFPSRGLTVVGVTGTDGKTTTVNMIHRILSDAGLSVSTVSTINVFISGKSYDTPFHTTNLSPFSLQKYIRQAKSAGSNYLVLEVTSHGLDQFRDFGVKFNIGVITNITHEHLDYHKTFENYLNSKAKLIKHVKVAVLNKADPNFKKLSKKTSGKVVSFGIKKDADVNIHNTPIKLKLPGDYNRENALAAAAVCMQLGVPKKQIISSLSKFETLPGRMEKVKNKLGVKIVIDFAHTPNALEQTLNSLRRETRGKLIAIFGAASERDVGKRPIMGGISAKLANITILTDEDPRFESSEKIIAEIERGATAYGAKIGETLFREGNRFKAIELGLSIACKGDTVGIFGKGHERSMSYRGVEREWSDRDAIRRILDGRKD